MSWSRFDTLRNRLVLLIFAITAAAIGFVYLYVVPQLESSLTAEKLRRLERLGNDQAQLLAQTLADGAPQAEVENLVRSLSQATESRVTLLAVRDEGESAEPDFVVADSQGEPTAIQGSYDAAANAVADGRVSSQVETIAGERVGASAVPVAVDSGTQWVAVLSSPLDDVDDNVALIRRQILIAGGIALAAAGLVGFWAAGAVSRRLRRLRRAAEQVARGDFSQPIPIESHDELGQLARSFNEMQRRLERLDSSRKEFIANASHELRTPIFSLGGFVELLETEQLTAEERRRFVTEMRGQIERLEKLTLDLLDLSKLDADAMEIRRERVDLKRLAREVAGEFRPAARSHDSKLEVRGRGQATALADPDRVSQIIRILIDNALTHTAEGTVVTVTAVSGNGAAQLIVGDDGRGIEPRAIGRVFDRFYSGGSATGSGLGLAIAAELAARMGGDLQVVSQRGFTAFTLSLPLGETRRGRRRPPAEAPA
ncbi:MAG TPA: HAMP domain-containing sensor histidine kinase [Solirubrobacterales bacterium]|nr:HAMP domain-containing sensor histidine kinase [Solirubrobacterales bacterium]